MAETIADLATRYRAVRATTEWLCAPLELEDQVAQSMPDASPVKWHRAHTTWFFETFVLASQAAAYTPFDPAFAVLFNSYYNAIGAQFPRAQRGLLTRPTVREVTAYRAAVDAQMEWLFARVAAGEASLDPTPITLGLHHEQQHQELILTDLKHLLSFDPRHPVYRPVAPTPAAPPPRLEWTGHDGGLVEIGAGTDGFAFDNERPRHRAFVAPFELANRPLTAGEVEAFIADDGYRRPALWLSDGWAAVRARGWEAPLYWTRVGEDWWQHTLSGFRPVEPAEPACHLSYYEADAIARWAGARLPTEQEWELVARGQPVEGNLLDGARFHPAPASDTVGPTQLFGDVWEWTASPYTAYPGYQTPPGAVGEYNAKFMCSQIVLRGGSCATPRDHLRATYRNFFPPDARWQFSGVRLAR